MNSPVVPTLTPVALPRRLDPAEAFFWFLDHVSSMNFTAIAEGRGASTTRRYGVTLTTPSGGIPCCGRLSSLMRNNA